MTVLEHLTAARANFAQQLYELSDPLKRRPSYSIGGRSVQWTEYMRFLREQIAELDAMISGESDDGGTLTATAVE